MVNHNVDHLLVVEKELPEKMVGFLSRTDIIIAYARSSQSASYLKGVGKPGM
jgi:hypothetical protein